MQVYPIIYFNFCFSFGIPECFFIEINSFWDSKCKFVNEVCALTDHITRKGKYKKNYGFLFQWDEIYFGIYWLLGKKHSRYSGGLL